MSVRSKSRSAPTGPSPFAVEAEALPAEKFADPDITAAGEPRASVPLTGLDTLWLNTGTLCNLACVTCYIESSPTNDALVYLSAEDAARFYAEAEGMGTREIGFTGGEPFMNPAFLPMLTDALARGFEALVLTNAMKPMRRHEEKLLLLRERFGDALTLRVSLDHHTRTGHEGERGPRTWDVAIDGLRWLSDNGFAIAVAGRLLPGEGMVEARERYAALFARETIAIDAYDPAQLVLFPEMDATKDVAEITTACWDILGKSPADIMCASSRMVVHRKGEDRPRVAACTLIPHDPEFDLGETLEEAAQAVKLNHPHCARFCVLGGASCSA
ncbi:radical SAM protein [Pseudoblastomonas halimionae]|uniref:Radical SAM protein n=1 Tax=Alteriqipengyuania halimionae TaxID=1926630 RepID=A0A6I4U7V1_9SPHN|nr:radical SAM protein [Alteriqipengyuania halimionae]MXP10317.1 radical SAM protein [Alteriqipengyuania halimionae]